jgi:hypothetical protein
MKRLKKELWIILLIISIVVCIGECGKAQIVIDTIDVSKMSKAQLRIVLKNYNKSLVLENDNLKIQVKAEIKNNQIARKKYSDSLTGMNDYFKKQIRYKLDSAKSANKLIKDSLELHITKLRIETKAKIASEKIAMRTIRIYKNIIIGSVILIVLMVSILIYLKRKLTY